MNIEQISCFYLSITSLAAQQQHSFTSLFTSLSLSLSLPRSLLSPTDLSDLSISAVTQPLVHSARRPSNSPPRAACWFLMCPRCRHHRPAVSLTFSACGVHGAREYPPFCLVTGALERQHVPYSLFMAVTVADDYVTSSGVAAVRRSSY